MRIQHLHEFLSRNKTLFSFLFLCTTFTVFYLSFVATYGLGTFITRGVTLTEPAVGIFARVVSPFVPPGEEPVEAACAISFRTTRGWYEYPPVGFEIRFVNSGNTHLVPSGVIEIFNFRGEKVGVISINPDGEVVLPGKFHLFEEPWNFSKWCCGLLPRFGWYTAKAQFSYGSGSATVELGPISFWIIPWKVLLILLGILLLGLASLPLFFFLWLWPRKRRLLSRTFIKEIESRERSRLFRKVFRPTKPETPKE